jgi:hypothetical protein
LLSPELHQEQIPSIFAQFQQAVGEITWLDRAAAVREEIIANAWLREPLLEQNRVVLSLSECSTAAANNRNTLPWDLTGDPKLREALVFAWQTLLLIDAARKISKKRANILTSRIKEAIRQPRMLQAMQLEAQVATHFLVLGKRVIFPELGNGHERFDVLIEDLGPVGLEIECKVVTYDKGRKIHRHEARQFLSKLLSSAPVQLAAKNGTRGLAVRVTVPNRLPAPHGLDELCQSVERVVLAGSSSTLEDGTMVHVSEFDRLSLGRLTRPLSSETLDAVAHITGVRNPHCAIFAGEGNSIGVVVVVIDSAQPDSMLHELFATYSESAGRQLTGRRPGALFSIFEGLGHEQLADIVMNEGKGGVHSNLAWGASAFLERSEFPHVVGVGFLSEPDYSTEQSLARGIAYWIPKRTSPMWHDDFSGLFGTDPRTAVLVR